MRGAGTSRRLVAGASISESVGIRFAVRIYVLVLDRVDHFDNPHAIVQFGAFARGSKSRSFRRQRNSDSNQRWELRAVPSLARNLIPVRVHPIAAQSFRLSVPLRKERQLWLAVDLEREQRQRI